MDDYKIEGQNIYKKLTVDDAQVRLDVVLGTIAVNNIIISEATTSNVDLQTEADGLQTIISQVAPTP